MLSPSSQSTHKELQRLLSKLPPESIWRDVRDNDNKLLAKGIGHEEDGIDSVLEYIDFKAKSVLDLGSNLGHNTFLALQGGAKHVVGMECDPVLVRGARLIASMHKVSNVDFMEADFFQTTDKDTKRKFDIVLLVDFIGKNMIRKGRLKPIVRVLRHCARREIILTVRPLYRIRKHFGMSEEDFSVRSSSPHVQGKHFFAGLELVDLLKPEWALASTLHSDLHTEDTDKILLHFIRKA